MQETRKVPLIGSRDVSSVASRGFFLAVFVAVFTGHALYIRHLSSVGTEGWADNVLNTGPWGLGAYLEAQDYYTSFSYALGSAFSAWTLLRFASERRAATAAGAAGSMTLMGLLLAGGCFLIGCCGSPMLAVYLTLFGARALGFGKLLMATVTMLSVGVGYRWLSHRSPTMAACDGGQCCKPPGGLTQT